MIKLGSSNWENVDISNGINFCSSYIRGYLANIAGVPSSSLKRYNWVYVLECNKVSEKEVEDKHKTFFDGSVPVWAKVALGYDKLLYVGSTNNIVERIHEHEYSVTVRGEAENPTMFTTYFPIKKVVKLIKYDSLDMARRKEGTWAKIFKDRHPKTTFVYWA